MTQVTVAHLLAQIESRESETVEFKTSFNDEAIEAIGAFANARGGVVLVDVSDTGEIKGCQIGKKTIEDVAHRIQEATDPRIQPSISAVTLEGKSILAIEVASSYGVPVSIRGRFYKRTGKSKQRMSHEEIMQRITTSAGLSWDAQTEPTATLDDLDFTSVTRFIEITHQLGRRPFPEHMPPEMCLRKLGLIREQMPTRAALLLFGKTPDPTFHRRFLN